MNSASPFVFDSQRIFPVAARVLAIKRTLVARFLARGVSMALIREAIAAAESQAWLSGYPDLFLPDLAGEILEHLELKHADHAHSRHAHPEYAQAA